MNEKLSRPQFNQMDTIEKQTLMESLADRYDMTFLGLHTFDHWGQSCTTTGRCSSEDGREFVSLSRRYRHPGLGASARRAGPREDQRNWTICSRSGRWNRRTRRR